MENENFAKAEAEGTGHILPDPGCVDFTFPRYHLCLYSLQSRNARCSCPQRQACLCLKASHLCWPRDERETIKTEIKVVMWHQVVLSIGFTQLAVSLLLPFVLLSPEDMLFLLDLPQMAIPWPDSPPKLFCSEYHFNPLTDRKRMLILFGVCKSI